MFDCSSAAPPQPLSPSKMLLPLLSLILTASVTPILEGGPVSVVVQDSAKWVQYEAGEGAGAGKHIVLIGGDEEYRSEEGLPMLARILAVRHGFRCTVLFSQKPESGEIDPEDQVNIPGIEHVKDADMLVLFLRFREPTDEWMTQFQAYMDTGRPILGIRTSTHAFAYKRNKESPFAHYNWTDKTWPGGWGKQILGETWVAHHGAHGSESTRGVIEASSYQHPILRGVIDIWGGTDVYRIRELPEDATVLVRGMVMAGMQPDSPPVISTKNVPMIPIIWTREIALPDGGTRRTICSTIGASQDLLSNDLRRCLINSCYWGLGLESQIPEQSDARLVGTYEPTPFGFGKYTRGIWPKDHALSAEERAAATAK
ncbi:MAG: hypothetical protein ACI841_001307 [Planctomycetota bacterium]|jgi:hypothetical protein